MIKNSIVIFLKEMRCLFRDRKTFIISLIIPLFLAPFMLFMTDFSSNISKKRVNENLIIAMNDKNNSFYKFCVNQKNIIIKDVKDESLALEEEEILVYLNIQKDLDENVLLNKPYEIEIKYNPSSINSMMAMNIIADYESKYKTLITENDINSFEDLDKITSEAAYIPTNTEMVNTKNSLLYFEMLTPIMMLLYCCLGCFNTASELSIGEKERGTWEPLLATGVNRESIALGKLFASSLIGFLSVLLTILGLLGYLLFSLGWNQVQLKIINIFSLFLISLFIALFVSSVSFAIGINSRSYKESQLYLMPVSVLIVLPSFFLSSINIHNIDLLKLSIPILNIICVIKEQLSGINNPYHLFIVILWITVYTGIFFKVIFKSFEKESIIFRT